MFGGDALILNDALDLELLSTLVMWFLHAIINGLHDGCCQVPWQDDPS